MTEVPQLRRFWYPVAFESALAEGPVARRLLGEDLVVWSVGPGTAAAARDRCPHREAQLSCGWTDGGRVVCPYHGWEFGGDGRAARIPQLPAGAPAPPGAQLDTVLCQVRYGVVWVSLDPKPLGGLPEIHEHGAAGWRVVPEREWMFDCSAAHLIENNFDPAHVAFVHRKTFGNPERAEVPVPTMHRLADGFRSETRTPVEGRHGQAGQTYRITAATFMLPFVGVIRIGYEDGLRHVMVKGCCPVDDRVTRLVQFVVRNDREEDVPAADILAFDDAVEAEDQQVLRTVPADYPLDLSRNVHLRSDRASFEMRRLYRSVVAGTWPRGVGAGDEEEAVS